MKRARGKSRFHLFLSFSSIFVLFVHKHNRCLRAFWIYFTWKSVFFGTRPSFPRLFWFGLHFFSLANLKAIANRQKYHKSTQSFGSSCGECLFIFHSIVQFGNTPACNKKNVSETYLIDLYDFCNIVQLPPTKMNWKDFFNRLLLEIPYFSICKQQKFLICK